MKITVHRRLVKAKSVGNIFEAVEIQNKFKKIHPTADVEIERTEGGGMNSYRVVIVWPMEIDLPEKPVLDPLPYPEFKPRNGYRGSRNRPHFGKWSDFGADRDFEREVQDKNGKAFRDNQKRLSAAEAKHVFPQFKN